ncbi:ROK family protein [Mucilaginibacter sp. CSA2-8R]|uniref:ROK family protein n=1 Tax=Mucilaginibacter sp. CSA2-8R TaxID=3141542 RepID=UPI00315CCCD0
MATDTDLRIGIDLGGTNTKYALITADGTILEKGRIATADYPDAASFVDGLHEQLLPLIEKHNAKDKLKGIGIGAPNANFFTGNIEHAVNLKWKDIVPLAKMVSDKFGLKCVLNNDAKVAALGEHTFGVAKNMSDFIMITLGTGVGSGIFVNGSLLYGCKGNAGELGHTVIRHNGRIHWSTGLKGTVESYCSATGIAITAKEMLHNAEIESQLSQYKDDELTSKAVYDCAVNGDELAVSVFKFTGNILGEALANFALFSAPEAIVLFGGVMRAGDMISQPAQQSFEEHLITSYKGQVKLLHSSLDLDDAAILGASRLV